MQKCPPIILDYGLEFLQGIGDIPTLASHGMKFIESLTPKA